MGEHLMRTGEALDYIESSYDVRWSHPTIHRYVKNGRLRGVQPGGYNAWWLVSRESIDEMFDGSKRAGGDT